MPIVESELALLRHPRLAALATSAWPAWLWSADGSRMLVGQCGRRGDLRRRQHDGMRAAPLRRERQHCRADHPPGRDAAGGAPERLERLRGFGAGLGGALTCACSRIALGDRGSAMLVAATEPAGPALTLTERVRRLFADVRGAARGFRAGRHADLCQRGGADPARRRTTLSALGNRDARRHGAGDRKRARRQPAWATPVGRRQRHASRRRGGPRHRACFARSPQPKRPSACERHGTARSARDRACAASAPKPPSNKPRRLSPPAEATPAPKRLRRSPAAR